MIGKVMCEHIRFTEETLGTVSWTFSPEIQGYFNKLSDQRKKEVIEALTLGFSANIGILAILILATSEHPDRDLLEQYAIKESTRLQELTKTIIKK